MEVGTFHRVRALVATFADDTPAVAQEITERIRAEIDELRAIDDPAFWDVVTSSTCGNLATAIAVVTQGRRMPDSSPLDAAAAARVAAERGVSLAALLRAYRIAHRVLWGEWMRRAQELDVPAAEHRRVLEHGSDLLFAFVDHIASQVTDEYTREREAMVRERAQRRVRLVQDLIDGTVLDARGLDYDLDLEHVAVVASGEGAQDAIHAMAHGLGRRLLHVATEDGRHWGWIGGRAPLAAGQLGAVTASGDGVILGIGDPLAGHAGFRTSHVQAADAHLVAQRLGVPCRRYGDVTLEAFALRDERGARAFVARELRGLDGDDDRSAKLRATLRAYFAAGHNASAAGAALGVHDQTISYRLRTVEERVGQPVSTRRAELELALRLDALLRLE